jgi:hypothetical protein
MAFLRSPTLSDYHFFRIQRAKSPTELAIKNWAAKYVARFRARAGLKGLLKRFIAKIVSERTNKSAPT